MISPSLATVNVALVAAFVGLAARPETPYIFATMSNLAYTFAAFYSELASANRGRLLGSLSESTLFLVIIGASSFGFHTRLRLGTPLHTLDIWGGWLLVAHAAYITISVLVIALTRVCLPTRHEETGTRVVRLGLSLSFMTGLTLITVYYDTIYANQMQFYFTIGGFAATAGLLARFVVTFKENGACSFRAAMIALFEIAILLTALASAVYSQGELIGRRLPNQKEEYDLFHVRAAAARLNHHPSLYICIYTILCLCVHRVIGITFSLQRFRLYTPARSSLSVTFLERATRAFATCPSLTSLARCYSAHTRFAR